jgi:kynurenine formamidase
MGVGAAAQDGECTEADYSGCGDRNWVDGDVMETPLGSKWWPHPLWGEGDQAGSTNWYTRPKVIARAIAQIHQNRSMKLGHEYVADMPLFGVRQFTLRIPGTPTGGPFGPNRIIWNDEYLSTEVGQVGTQFDGLGHIGVVVGAPGNKNEMRWYNGFSATDIADAYGLKALGTERLHPIIARGVLIDVAGYHGVDSMNAGDVINIDDVRGALAKQGMADFVGEPGDAIIWRTGWEAHWGNPETYNSGSPGIGMDVARWIAEEVRPGVTGSDTWAGDAVPNDVDECFGCVHQFLQARHGIVNQENMKLSELARMGVHLFAYFYSPVPIRGATGSIGAPVAIY